MKKVHKLICRSPFSKLLATAGRSALEFYENRNYDMRTNGEQRLIRLLATFCPKVVFDVGANVGDWSRIALASFPGATIYAFEPAPHTFNQLKENLGAESSVQLFQFGLSDRDEIVQFRYYPSRSGQSSRYDYSLREEPEMISVELLRGDEFCQRHSVAKIDLLKIDVEGADLDVLKGFENMLGIGGIDVIQFEYGRINIRSRALLCDFYDYLTPRGFRIGKLFPYQVEFRPYDLRHENFIGPNFVAVREDRQDIMREVGVTLQRPPKI